MFFVWKKIYGGQSLLRILMNIGFRGRALRGKVVDVGGGRSPDYFDYFNMTDVISREAVDGSISHIDFEKDALPYTDASVDTVLCANVLEHVYAHMHLTREMHRILVQGGALVGFVPFLIQYHPDPHDYFRYTKEALRRIFEDAGFKDIDIREIGGGPLAVNFNNLVLSLRPLVGFVLFPLYWGLDHLYVAVRPGVRARYPLGYVFTARK